jgi:predicted phosphodiesterase
MVFLMKLIWLTDVHFNFLSKEDRKSFYEKIAAESPDKILISGDIAEADSVSMMLKEMVETINKPIYFVLGNHDYYNGQVNLLRSEMSKLTAAEPLLYWLPASGPQYLGDGTILLGQDCWADGRNGNYLNSPVILNDSLMIHELFSSRFFGKNSLLKAMQKLADADAQKLSLDLSNAIKNHFPKKIIVLIHIPPFVEACMHQGEISNDDFLPFFSSQVTGDVLLNVANAHPDIEFLVFCGHTHSNAYWQPCSNMTVKAGSAEYRRPEIQEIIELSPEPEQSKNTKGIRL